jgi:hypothetical protein
MQGDLARANCLKAAACLTVPTELCSHCTLSSIDGCIIAQSGVQM